VRPEVPETSGAKDRVLDGPAVASGGVSAGGSGEVLGVHVAYHAQVVDCPGDPAGPKDKWNEGFHPARSASDTSSSS
jgi:hypothetical protein